MDNSEPAEGV